MLRRLLSLLCCLIALQSSAQTTDHQPGTLLVQLGPQTNAARWARQFDGLELRDTVSRPLHVFTFTFDPFAVQEQQLLSAVRGHREVLNAQFDHFLELRSAIPNDTLYQDQWQYNNPVQVGNNLNIESAWDVTTGGLTFTNDTIVVCIIDNGVDIDHPDIQANLWRNHREIPGNNIDDDGNGYVDDYLGWSTVTDDDRIDGGTHGTSVSGIVGASGNNQIGVAGVNWNVQLMTVRNNFSTLESEVIAAYSYPLEFRMRYNATNGAEGAFVVATNASWGLPNGQPGNSPIWCALYDTLGHHGILNVGATDNREINVDIAGDLPTGCPSDFLVSVTNVDRFNNKVEQAGFGPQSIDLGAYGELVFTTRGSAQYGLFGGTSAATPHVTGAIGLLYSAPCPSLMALSKSDPAAAALLLKQLLLDGTTPTESLAGITLTGGRLNIGNSMTRLLDLCDTCFPPTSVNLADRALDSVRLSWKANDSLQTVSGRYRLANTSQWIELGAVSPPLVIAGLNGCTTYEFQLRGQCGEGQFSNYTSSFFFETDGCCELPAATEVIQTTDSTALIRWESVLVAQSFDLRYRPRGQSDWTEINRVPTFAELRGLSSCTAYEYEIRSDCDTSITAYGLRQEFRTTGCGTCLDATYCEPGGLSNEEEWIAEVNIGNILINESTEEAESYTNYGLTIDPVPLAQGASYPIRLVPGFFSINFAEAFAVYIDLDQNGSITSSEKVYEGNSQSGGALSGTLTIPPTATMGITRMRVVMQFMQTDSPCPIVNSQGEVEDYCIQITPPVGACVAPISFQFSPIDTTSGMLLWGVVTDADQYELRYRTDQNAEWQVVSTPVNQAALSNLRSCTEYEFEVRAQCGDAAGAVAVGTFSSCVSSNENAALLQQRWRLSPVPATDELRILWEGTRPAQPFQLQLADARGVVIDQQRWQPTASEQLVWEIDALPSGVYFLRLLTAGGTQSVKRLVKVD